MVLYINPVHHAPGVKNGHAPGGSLAPIDLQWEKHKKNLLLQNHKAQSFHILSVAIYSGPLYKSCQPCPWGLYGPRPGGVMGKTLKNLLLRNHKAQSFHILFLAMYSGPLYKSCQLGSIRAPPRGRHGKNEKNSETIWPRAFICCVDQCMILSFINAANGAPGVHTGHTPGMSLSTIDL